MKKFYPRFRVQAADADAQLAAGLLLETMGYASIPELSSLKRIFVVNQRCGRAYLGRDAITIPEWVMRKEAGQIFYYVAHEMAHFFAYYKSYQTIDGMRWRVIPKQPHGPEFMHWFKKICPEDWWHYETNYKPRHAKAAGITKPKLLQKIEGAVAKSAFANIPMKGK